MVLGDALAKGLVHRWVRDAPADRDRILATQSAGSASTPRKALKQILGAIKRIKSPWAIGRTEIIGKRKHARVTVGSLSPEGERFVAEYIHIDLERTYAVPMGGAVAHHAIQRIAQYFGTDDPKAVVEGAVYGITNGIAAFTDGVTAEDHRVYDSDGGVWCYDLVHNEDDEPSYLLKTVIPASALTDGSRKVRDYESMLQEGVRGMAFDQNGKRVDVPSYQSPAPTQEE